MARKNKDIEILVKLASQGNFDQAQEQLERLKKGQSDAAASGAGAIGKLQGAWKSWTSLAEVSAGKIKNAFLTALGPIGAIIVIVETVIRTFGKLISFIKDYQKAQEEVNKTFAAAAAAIAEANKNKEKYADTTGIDNLSKAIKAQQADLQAISKSHEEISKKVAEQKESYFGTLFVLASTTQEYRAQLGLLAQQKDSVDQQIRAKQAQSEAEKELLKATKEREKAEADIADRVAKLTLDDTAFKERELQKQVVAYEKAGADKAMVEELLAAENEEIAQEAIDKRLKAEEQLASRILQLKEDEAALAQMKLEEDVAAYQRAGADKTLIDEFRAAEMGRIGKIITKQEDEEAKKSAKISEAKVQMAMDIASGLAAFQNSKSKELAAVGKAGAIAETMIHAHMGAGKAVAKVELFPFNFVLAGIIEAAGLAKAATIAGIELEKGGVVPGSMAGTAATIGEKGKAEAVIPLEDPRAMRMVGEAISDAGGTGGGAGTIINLNVNATLEWRAVMNALAEEAESGAPEIIRLATRLQNLAARNAGRAA